MKKLILLLTILISLIVNRSNNLTAQCINQVTHTTGTMTVNGVNVTVTSSGLVDTLPGYCPNATPYLVGYTSPASSGTGTYTFNFSPSINSLTLNFSGISNTVSVDSEIVMLFVNGVHYAIPSAGTYNGCDSIATLTSSGDISGCANCGISGWNGTTISGIISSISVYDTTLIGNGGGALFSLFICNAINDGIANLTNGNGISIYPNPFSLQTTIDFAIEQKNSTIKITDVIGKEIKTINFTGKQVAIDKGEMKEGVYFVSIIDEKKNVVNKKIIIR